jgi:hypothetical protein
MFPSNQLSNINKAPETNNEDVVNLPDIDNNLINNLNKEINGEITSEEIVSCVKNLKNDKASGDDLKYTRFPSFFLQPCILYQKFLLQWTKKCFLIY